MHTTRESMLNSLLQQNKLIRDYWLLKEGDAHWSKVELVSVEPAQDEGNPQQSLTGIFKVFSTEPSPIGTISLPLLLELDGRTYFTATKPILFPRNPTFQEGIEDLTQLSFLNEPEVLNNLLVRYRNFSIYTYCGIVLVAINPYCELSQLYSDQMMSLYHRKDREQVEPHLFVVAEEAYQQMLQTGRSQSIIISGESGAGKTVSAKYIMKYLISKENLAYRYIGSPTSTDIRTVENKILATNPILEAFGNAKTTRNDNSSRFGKFLQISFLPQGSGKKVAIWDARIRTFLLEKSRVTHQAKGEQNFHIFYLLAGHSEFAEKFHLSDRSVNLNLLPNDKFNNCSFKTTMQEILDAFELFDFTPDEIDNIFAALAIILHLGSIEIHGDKDQSHISLEDPHLIWAAELLQATADDLSRAIVTRTISTNLERITAGNSKQLAISIRDSYCRSLYSLLFDYVVAKLNQGLSNDDCDNLERIFISVLDIYGFEQFDTNGFEQFCINYANEKLQQEFVKHAFQLEQQVFSQEQIEWPDIQYQENDLCIQAIEDKMGVLDILDDCCKLSSATDRTFVQKILRSNPLDATERAQKWPVKPLHHFKPDHFQVHHYAGTIEYDGNGFLDKNRDEFLLFPFNSNPIAMLFGNQQQSKRKASLGIRFKESLNSLMNTIYTSNTHYIRCIKPNHTKASFSPDSLYTLSQLKACGIIESTKIYSQGFPTKIPLDEFRMRYRILCMEKCSIDQFVKAAISLVYSNDEKNRIETMDSKDDGVGGASSKLDQKVCAIEQTCLSLFRIGKTRLFLRSGIVARLEREKERIVVHSIEQIQIHFLASTCKSQFLRMLHCSVVVQSLFRSRIYQLKRLTMIFERASEILHKYCKAFLARTQFQSLLLAQSTICILIRRHLHRVAIHFYYSIRLQSFVRSTAPRAQLQQMQRSLALLQSLARAISDRHAYDLLKAESRNLDLLQEKLHQYQQKFFHLLRENEQLVSALSQYRQTVASLFDSLQSTVKPAILSHTQNSLTSLSCSQQLGHSLNPDLIVPMLAVSPEVLTEHVRFCIQNNCIQLNKFLSDSMNYLYQKGCTEMIAGFFEKVQQTFSQSWHFRTETEGPMEEEGKSNSGLQFALGNKEGLGRCLYWLVNFISFYEQKGYTLSDLARHLRTTISLLYSKVANWYKDSLVANGARCIVESQSLSGYIVSVQPNRQQWDLDFLTACLDSMLLECGQYGLSLQVKQQLVRCLFRALCTESLNMMLTLKGYCNWKRGMQIQFNISRLLEWARDSIVDNAGDERPLRGNSSSLSINSTGSGTTKQSFLGHLQGTLQRLLQASKLVQLNTTVLHDFDTILQIATQLSPAQVARLLSMIACPSGMDLDLFLPYRVDPQVINRFVQQYVTPEDTLVVQWHSQYEPIDLSQLGEQ